jgi:hypothetical protein
MNVKELIKELNLLDDNLMVYTIGNLNVCDKNGKLIKEIHTEIGHFDIEEYYE